MFGTFRDKLKVVLSIPAGHDRFIWIDVFLKETGPSTYRGGSEEKTDAKSAAIHDSKATLGLPEPGFAVYIGVNCMIWALLWQSAAALPAQTYNPHLIAFLVSFGPLILAQVMANLTEKSKRSIFYPFHKDGWKTMSSHLVVSALACIAPVYILVHMLLSQPGGSFYFWLRG